MFNPLIAIPKKVKSWHQPADGRPLALRYEVRVLLTIQNKEEKVAGVNHTLGTLPRSCRNTPHPAVATVVELGGCRRRLYGQKTI
jgi:hypothetical protein